MSQLYLGVQTQDLPTITIAGVTASPINTAGMLVKTERGIDDVIRLNTPEQIYAALGRFRSGYNAHYCIKGFFDNLQGEPGTLYVKRMVPANAVAATVDIQDAGAAETAWTFTAGRFGVEDPGVWGNQLWVNVIADSRASGTSTTTFNGSVTAVTTFSVDSVSQFEVADWIKVVGDNVTTPEYYKIGSIDETNSTITVEGSGSSVNHSTDTLITYSVVDFQVKVYLKDSDTGNVELQEDWTNLSPDADSPYYIGTVINDDDLGSNFVYFTDGKSSITDKDDFPAVAADDFANADQLTTGADGTDLNTTQMAAALSAFDDYPIRYLTNTEAFSETVWDDGEAYCNVRKDCVWVGTPEWAEAQTRTSLETWANKRRKSRKVHAFNNGTWYYVDDPISTEPNPIKRVPNVGHMIGYSIWISGVRGIHKVPAGRLQVPVGIRSLANEIVSKVDLRDLANIGLNMQTTVDGEFPIRSARTPSKLKEWRWINSVNMQIFFKKSFEQSFVNLENEPNKANLLNRIRTAMTNFALEFYKTSSNGGNEGGFAEGSFSDVVRIIVDDSINPRAQVNDGIVKANFYFATPSPAERIVIGVGLLFNQ